MSETLKKNLGLIILLSSLLIYSLIKLPLNLSVLCNSENEGFYFVYGKTFLEWKEFFCGPLFILLYALVIKFFGFNTFSIIAIHFIQNVSVILISILLYLILRKLLESSLIGSFVVLCWLFFILTPIGHMSILSEILSHFGVEAEYFCVLFSLLSILCLLYSGFVKDEISLVSGFREKFCLFLSGMFSLFPLMFKPSGGVLFLAFLAWTFILVVSKKEKFVLMLEKIIYFLAGTLLSFILFQLFIHYFSSNSFLFWRDYFVFGSYSQDFIKSPTSIFKSIIDYMTRGTASISNFFLFSLSFIFFIWGFFRSFFFKKREQGMSRIWLLLSIWGIGNSLVIIVPGIYQPYYYHLIWPIIAIVLILGIRDLFCLIEDRYKKLITFILGIIFCLFVTPRLFWVIPKYIELHSRIEPISIFNQPESFQDPVEEKNGSNIFRPVFLKFADTINKLLPDKNDNFYVFNFNKVQGHTSFTTASYIYAKRYPPTHILSDLLDYRNLLDKKLEILKRSIVNRPPRFFVISKDVYIEPWQIKILTPFINWFNDYVMKNYVLKLSLVNKQTSLSNQEIFFVYERKA